MGVPPLRLFFTTDAMAGRFHDRRRFAMHRFIAFTLALSVLAGCAQP
jgi:hypothetical protein